MRANDEIKVIVETAFTPSGAPERCRITTTEDPTRCSKGRARCCGAPRARSPATGSAFLDQAPAGYSSALSFFSDEAFRYFLPAYLLADLDGALDAADPVFHLCHGLDDATRAEKVNPRRYGDRTWLETMRYRLSVFTRQEARAIVAYLRCKATDDECARGRIEQAIKNYWSERAA